MTPTHRVVTALRLFLVVLFAVIVVFQFLSLPGQFAHMADESPEDAYLRWPLTAISFLWLLCVEVVIVAMWKLLTMVRDGRIFSDAALVWVNAIVGAIVVAWALLAAVFLYVGIKAGDPGLPLVLFLLVVGVAVVGLLMIVMHALLLQATTLRTDMEAVI